MQSMYYIGLDVHKRTISYCVKEVDLRSLATPCGGFEGSPPADAAGDCGSEEEERSHRCRQDMRLSAL